MSTFNGGISCTLHTSFTIHYFISPPRSKPSARGSVFSFAGQITHISQSRVSNHAASQRLYQASNMYFRHPLRRLLSIPQLIDCGVLDFRSGGENPPIPTCSHLSHR